ncbi:hypothetical protein BaRGS_00015061 [Batillaria attramentaria]|uniref:Uncharacterized protein n=1 Tax=Batillaria attramentaria TaxID=370345 RepID=A0ABD0L338_9CAEN
MARSHASNSPLDVLKRTVAWYAMEETSNALYRRLGRERMRDVGGGRGRVGVRSGKVGLVENRLTGYNIDRLTSAHRVLMGL